MELVNKIKTDMVESMKSGDKQRLSTLRLLKAELEKEKVTFKLEDITKLSDEQAQTVISRQIKKLDKEIESYVAVGRSTESQEAEKEVLFSYIPKQLSDDEIRELVLQIKESCQNVGMAMKELSAKLKGKADMSKVSKIVKSEF